MILASVERILVDSSLFVKKISCLSNCNFIKPEVKAVVEQTFATIAECRRLPALRSNSIGPTKSMILDRRIVEGLLDERDSSKPSHGLEESKMGGMFILRNGFRYPEYSTRGRHFGAVEGRRHAFF